VQHISDDDLDDVGSVYSRRRESVLLVRHSFFTCLWEQSFEARGICVKRVRGHVLAFLRTPTRFIFIIQGAIEDYHRDRVSPRISTFDANDHEITKKNVSLAIPEMLPIWQNVARNESKTDRNRLRAVWTLQKTLLDWRPVDGVAGRIRASPGNSSMFLVRAELWLIFRSKIPTVKWKEGQ